MGTDAGTEPTDIRWIQRFENLERALALIKAYEVSFELSWKTLKDLLAWNGVDARLPREVLKQAFAAGLLENGQRWIDMLEQRNLLAHTYDEARALQAAARISTSFWPALTALQHSLAQRRSQQRTEPPWP